MAMSIDEAIQHCEEMALCAKNGECGEEHRQLAEWLRELKRLRAEPVRHGYWRPILHVCGKTDYECSCCLGIIADVPDDDEHDLCAWCSMCGARMDGGAE